MKKSLYILIALLLSAVMYGCSSSGAVENDADNNKENKPTITLAETNWTSTLVPTEIVKNILENMGYKVEGQQAELGAVYTGLSTGDVDIFMDSWAPQQNQYMNEYSDTIERISASYEDARAGMVVPKYMEDINDVGDLKGKEDMVNNEILAISESDPAMEDLQDIIDAYNLDVEMINSSEGAMLAAAKAKIEKKEPVLLYGWEPHSMFQLLDLKILTNNKVPEIYGDTSVHVVVNKGLKEKAPKAYKFLSNWSISIDDMEDMITKIDNGQNPEDVAQTWVENHQDKIDKMKGD
ncbi:ABC transporter substrate-binding protein [Lentibacillus kapialis]|uniref:ABC transporter substrate-binding protein n=1 Tax=Lentibacillus kapialis TaxID=340214 RepID=A0A917PY99_9BACI|nr:glycine betaine ABC transporter substrate-binding protein [Lentibacillus kapialis]GGK00192.1 ABC transporter substrate-binding protein [Lentibacillus kapialis]